METEIWKPVKGYENLYEVSNLGRVKSVKDTVTGGIYKGKLRKPAMSQGGYYCILLCKESRYKNCFVHRLVAEAFIENPEEKPIINHIDGDKLNNKLGNLEWATYSENTFHAYDAKLFPAKHNQGTSNGSSKITEKDVLEIRSLAKGGLSRREISNIFGIGKTTVTEIVNKKLWKHVN